MTKLDMSVDRCDECLYGNDELWHFLLLHKWHGIKWCLRRVISKGGFRMGDFKTRQITELGPKMKSLSEITLC